MCWMKDKKALFTLQEFQQVRATLPTDELTLWSSWWAGRRQRNADNKVLFFLDKDSMCHRQYSRINPTEKTAQTKMNKSSMKFMLSDSFSISKCCPEFSFWLLFALSFPDNDAVVAISRENNPLFLPGVLLHPQIGTTEEAYNPTLTIGTAHSK